MTYGSPPCEGRQNTRRGGKEWPAPSVPSVPEETGSLCMLVDSPSLAAAFLIRGHAPVDRGLLPRMGEHNWNCSILYCISEKHF